MKLSSNCAGSLKGYMVAVNSFLDRQNVWNPKMILRFIVCNIFLSDIVIEL